MEFKFLASTNSRLELIYNPVALLFYDPGTDISRYSGINTGLHTDDKKKRKYLYSIQHRLSIKR